MLAPPPPVDADPASDAPTQARPTSGASSGIRLRSARRGPLDGVATMIGMPEPSPPPTTTLLSADVVDAVRASAPSLTHLDNRSLAHAPAAPLPDDPGPVQVVSTGLRVAGQQWIAIVDARPVAAIAAAVVTGLLVLYGAFALLHRLVLAVAG